MVNPKIVNQNQEEKTITNATITDEHELLESKEKYQQAQKWLDSEYPEGYYKGVKSEIIKELENSKVTKEITLTLPLKEIPSKHWEQVEVDNDWDREYSFPLPNKVKLPIMINLLSDGYAKRFKTEKLLENFKKYTNGEEVFYSWAGTHTRIKIKDIPSDCFGGDEKEYNKWYSVGYYSDEKKLTQYLRDANKLFKKDGHGKVTSQEAFEFLRSIVESHEIKASVKFEKGDEIDLEEWAASELNIPSKNLTGKLDLQNFPNLRVLNCEKNQLTELDLSKCPKIKKVYCSENKLINIKFGETNDLEYLDAQVNYLDNLDAVLSNLSPEKLKTLKIGDNNFEKSTLEPFARFTNLEHSTIFSNFCGNSKVDKFIRKFQREGKWIEWIPYEQFTNVEYLAEGGFGKVYKSRHEKYGDVVLKVLNNSQDVEENFLREITNHTIEDATGVVVTCYGISQDPETKNYAMVMNYVPNGNLRQYLDNNSSKDLQFRILQLHYIRAGLGTVHKQGLIHRDFHPGNVLNYDDPTNIIWCYIADLGLSRPANEEKREDKIYGVMPYVAPEVLQGQPYTQASDIYSFGIVAYETLTGLPPYYDVPHDEFLALKICQGLRPKFNIKIPKLLEDFIKQCWDADPERRPNNLDEVPLGSWWWSIRKNNNYPEFAQQYKEAEEYNKTLPEEVRFPKYEIHPQAFYTSKLINTRQINELLKNLPKAKEDSSNPTEITEQIKAIEVKIEDIKKLLDSEKAELIDKFIEVKKESLKNKENEKIENNAWDLEDKLEEKELTTEKDKIIRYCEKLVELEQKINEEQLQVQVEIPFKRQN
jgi:serine/threonine protein kinase